MENFNKGFKNYKIRLDSEHLQLNSQGDLRSASARGLPIGARCMIAPNVTIMDSPFHPMWPLEKRNIYPGNELDRKVEIGEDVWVGTGAIILAGTQIGSGSIIGAGSLVQGNIPTNVLPPVHPRKSLES